MWAAGCCTGAGSCHVAEHAAADKLQATVIGDLVTLVGAISIIGYLEVGQNLRSFMPLMVYAVPVTGGRLSQCDEHLERTQRTVTAKAEVSPPDSGGPISTTNVPDSHGRHLQIALKCRHCGTDLDTGEPGTGAVARRTAGHAVCGRVSQRHPLPANAVGGDRARHSGPPGGPSLILVAFCCNERPYHETLHGRLT